MEKIINLTLQHTLSQSQIEAGLYNPNLSDEVSNTLKKLMVVDPEDTEEQLISHAKCLLELIESICEQEDCYNVHLMGQFELIYYVISQSFWDPINNINFYVSTTKRVSKEVTNPDGTVTKVNTFEFVKLRKIKPVEFA